MSLFDRKVSLTIGTREYSNFDDANGQVSGLRISFRVTRTSESVSDTAEIKVWNLSAGSREQQGDLVRPAIILAAGYPGNIDTLMQGKARLISSTREGSDWVTRIEVADGQAELSAARIQETFRKGTSVSALFERLAEKTGLGVQSAIDAIRAAVPSFGDGSTELQADASFSGKVQDAIDSFLDSVGFVSTVQDEQLVVARKTNVAQGEVVVLAPDTGLVGSVEVGLLGRITATSLLQPRIRPLRRLRVNTAQISGDYRSEKCEYLGDTHDAPWYTRVEATPL